MAAQTYKKHFIPLESSPEVFNSLASKLGLPPNLQFEDVLSLDVPDLLPRRPARALILVFPTDESYETRRMTQQQSDARSSRTNDGHPAAESNDDDTVVWFKQTINNACGLYAILHALCNEPTRRNIRMFSSVLLRTHSTDRKTEKEGNKPNPRRRSKAPGSFLATLLAQYTTNPPESQPGVLENSNHLEQIYAEAAQLSDSRAPETAEEEVDFHYVCFIIANKKGKGGDQDSRHLYELDGDHSGPVVWGQVYGKNDGRSEDEDDLLAGECLDLVREYIRSREQESIGFSLMALTEQDSAQPVD